MRRVYRGYFLAFIIATFCPMTIAKNLVVGLPMLQPYAAQNDNEVSGMYVEMLQAVFNQAGIDFIIRVMPPARITHEFRSGSLDVTVISNNTSTPSRFSHITKEPLSSDRIMLMKSRYSSPQMTTSAQLSNSSFAAIRGFSPDLSFISKSNLAQVNSRAQLLKMLFAGRVDYIIAEEVITSAFARQHNFPALSGILALENRSIFVVFSKIRLGKDAESLGLRFDTSLRQLAQRGELDDIREKYSKAP